MGDCETWQEVLGVFCVVETVFPPIYGHQQPTSLRLCWLLLERRLGTIELLCS